MSVLTAEPLLLHIDSTEPMSLQDTLNCGQCFRWQETDDGWFHGVVERRIARVRQTPEGLLLDAEGERTFWESYFDLGTDYAAIRRRLCQSQVLARAAAYAPGIRVLRQYPWETLCSFIISQNNHLARIRSIVERLCALLGEELAPGVFAFPEPQRLAALDEGDLAPLRAGFRAAYLLDAARRVSDGRLDLESIRTIPLEQARAQLTTIHGVGPKVAECVLLYGYARMECFPLDVWMKRAMTQLFPRGLPACAREHAGIAQQYLFHYVRTCPEALTPKARRSGSLR